LTLTIFLSYSAFMTKAGIYQTQGTYKSYMPRLLNEPLEIKNEYIQKLLAEAMGYLGELNAYTQLAPDTDYFIKMYIAREAAASSKIAGTRTEFLDVLQDDKELRAELNIDERDDLEEVQNYIKALNTAAAEIEKSSFSSRLLCNTHRALLSDVRGFTKAPGEVRKIQTWIGAGDIAKAVFIPPAAEAVPDLFKDLENYWYEDSNTPQLIKIALSHYQFETIHPFLDGNGRLGRLMIILQLIDAKILSKPALYVSDYFERHKVAYYDAFENVRISGDYEQWIRFFLDAVVESAQDAKDTLQNIVALRESYFSRIQNSPLSYTRQKNARELLTLLFAQPVVSIKQVSRMLGRSIQTASDLVDELENLGLLREMTGDAKNRKYALGEYFDLFNKPKEG
jgi:Fic family protein